MMEADFSSDTSDYSDQDGAPCNWCIGTPNACILYDSFPHLLFHAIDAHLQDAKFEPKASLCCPDDWKESEIAGTVTLIQPDPDVFLLGILLQLEPCEKESRFRRNYPYLYTEDGTPVVGPTGRHLRDIPGLPIVFDLDTQASLLMCWSRVGLQKDLIDRFPTGATPTFILDKIQRFQRNCYLPLLSWGDSRDRIHHSELCKFKKLTSLQIEHNTCGFPITEGYVLQPKPPNHAGYWRPNPQPIITNSFPHRAGYRIAHRSKVIRWLCHSPSALEEWNRMRRASPTEIEAWNDRYKDLNWFDDSELSDDKKRQRGNETHKEISMTEDQPTSRGFTESEDLNVRGEKRRRTHGLNLIEGELMSDASITTIETESSPKTPIMDHRTQASQWSEHNWKEIGEELSFDTSFDGCL